MAIEWGPLRAEIAAVRAGMFVLGKLILASDTGADLDVPSIYREAHRMMTLGHKHAPISATEMEKIKTICADGGRSLCPFCGCPHTEGDDPRMLEDGIIRNMACTRCSETWDNHYILIERYTI